MYMTLCGAQGGCAVSSCVLGVGSPSGLGLTQRAQVLWGFFVVGPWELYTMDGRAVLSLGLVQAWLSLMGKVLYPITPSPGCKKNPVLIATSMLTSH